MTARAALQATQQRQLCVAQVATSVEDEASAEVDRLDGGQLSAEIDAATRYLDRGKGSDGEPISIRYCVLGRGSEGLNGAAEAEPRVLLIMGFAAGLHGWKPQLLDMLQPLPGESKAPISVCLFDNRGVGGSSKPRCKRDYSTALMAADAKAVMDAVGWQSAHVIGFSMGGMVACKFAAAHPVATRSLTTIASSLGGWAVLPRARRTWKLALMFLMGDKGNRQRAKLDVKMHFSKLTLRERVGGSSRRRQDLLVREYVGPGTESEQQQQGAAAAKAAAAAAKAGQKGQFHAVWQHRLTKAERAALCAAEFPRMCIHGRQDIVALPSLGGKLAAAIRATFVVLEGAHFLVRERGHAVTLLLEENVLGQSRGLERVAWDPARHMTPELPDGCDDQPVSQDVAKGECAAGPVDVRIVASDGDSPPARAADGVH